MAAPDSSVPGSTVLGRGVVQFRHGELQLWPKEGEKRAGLIGRELVESIGRGGISMAGMSSDSSEFWGKARAEIV
jgi:hypothetical protein